MNEYRAVLFDMDGVIVDSEPHWRAIWVEEFFPKVEGDVTLDEVIGRDYTESFADLEERYGLAEDRETLEREFESHSERIYTDLADGDERVLELFDAVRDRGLPVGIVSSSPSSWIDQVVERFDIGPLDAVVSADEIDGPGKPEPDVYEIAADRLGVDPGDCLVIEDSENGVRAAAAAGATVTRFEQSGDPEAMAETHAVANDPDELRTILVELLDDTTE